ncbi:MAG: LeuA family protein [Gemmatimonadota bacterium]
MADSSDLTNGRGGLTDAASSQLIYDWNTAGRIQPAATGRIALFDQTLRDGLQAPSVQDPSPEDKRRLLHLMAALGISGADIGLPAAGPRMLAQVRDLAAEIMRQHLPIAASCAARTVVADIEPIVRVSQATGCPIEAATFVGSSELRHFVEGWSLDALLRSTEQAIGYAVTQGLAVMFVAEDASRTRPETLRRLCAAALDAGAARICLADTAGHATPAGVAALIEFVRREFSGVASGRIGLDWHGHRDRGLAIANCLAAIDAGADRIHGTGLGIGERAGNAEMDLLLVNLRLMGRHEVDLSRLPEYCALVSAATGIPMPANYPVMGRDAFRTGSGTHAAAILKAERKGMPQLADLVYSGVPATEFGLAQQITVSSHSGISNVRHWLGGHGYDPDDRQASGAILAAAKQSARTLTDEECHRLARTAGARSTIGAADAGN